MAFMVMQILAQTQKHARMFRLYSFVCYLMLYVTDTWDVYVYPP